MDPWLESPYIWGDFHQRFATTMSSWLTQRLPKPYYARLDSRPEVGIVEEEEGEKRRIGPDVAIVRRPDGTTAVKAAVSIRPISPDSLEVIVSSEAIKHVFVEVRDPTKGHELITLIEIASPSNKRPGKDRRSYLRKQSEVLSSNASLVEIDLLRGGKRLFASPEIGSLLTQRSRRTDYVILVNRAWTRESERTAFQVFPVSMVEALPCIPIPLRQHQEEVPLDLQELFSETYDHAPYLQGAVDYNERPDPPLPTDLKNWADDCLRKAGMLA
jgi:hypothetical protein